MSPDQTRPIELPTRIVERVKDGLPRTESDPSAEYITYVMEEVLYHGERETEDGDFEPVDQGEVEDRLESLGSLDEQTRDGRLAAERSVMDLLTHLCLPLTVAYVLRPALFEHPATLGLAVFGLLSDFDKFLGHPGLLHSLVTVIPVCLVVMGAERWYRGEWQYAPVIAAFIGSHLVLDVIDGGPVPLLYPFIEHGLGLQYPARTVFGAGPIGVRIEGPLVATRAAAPRPGYNTYGFLTGDGIAWAIVFLIVFLGMRRRRERAAGTRPVGVDGGDRS